MSMIFTITTSLKPVMVQCATYTSLMWKLEASRIDFRESFIHFEMKNIWIVIDSGFFNEGEGAGGILKITYQITELFSGKITSDTNDYSKHPVFINLKNVWRSLHFSSPQILAMCGGIEEKAVIFETVVVGLCVMRVLHVHSVIVKLTALDLKKQRLQNIIYRQLFYFLS